MKAIGRPPKPFYCRLQGYTWTVVIKAIEESGYPQEIKNIPKKQQGPMIVTLACELSAILIELLIQSVTKQNFEQKLEDLRKQYAEESYHILMNEFKTLSDSIVNLEFQMESMELSYGFIRPNTNKFSKNKLKIKDLSNPLINDESSKKYYSLIDNHQKNTKIRKTVSTKIKELSEKIESDNCFKKEREKLLNSINKKGTISVDFFSEYDLLHGGAAKILYITDKVWWSSFTSSVNTILNKDTSSSPSKIVLRALSDNIVGEKIVMETQQLLKDAHRLIGYNWPSINLSEAGVRQLRKTLREEDEYIRKWIMALAGKDHPLDPFRRKLDHKVNVGNSNISHERAINELRWCLSQRAPNSLPFEGYFTTSNLTKEDWETRVASWGNRMPDYWEAS